MVAVSGLVGAIFQNRTASVITYVIFIGSGISVRVVARAVNVTIAVGVANVILLAVAAGGRVCRTTFITFVIAIVVYVMTAIVRLLSAAVITKVVVIVSVNMRVGTRAVNGTSAVSITGMILAAVATSGHNVIAALAVTDVIAIVISIGVTKGSNRNTLGLILCPL